jgi:hypothetical protein
MNRTFPRSRFRSRLSSFRSFARPLLAGDRWGELDPRSSACLLVLIAGFMANTEKATLMPFRLHPPRTPDSSA